MLKYLKYLSLLSEVAEAIEAAKPGGTGLIVRPSYKGRKFEITVKRTD